MAGSSGYSSATIDELVAAYFRSWERQDESVLATIFADDISYRINGQIKYADLAAVTNYWLRNRDRQRGVRCTYKICRTDDAKSEALISFVARFYEPRLCKSTQISGTMEVRAKLGKIDVLEEWYEKFEAWRTGDFLVNGVPFFLGRYGTKSWKLCSRWFQKACIIAASVAVPILIIAYTFLIILTAHLNFVETLVDWIPDKAELAWNKVTNGGFAVGAIALGAMTFVRRKKGPFQSYRIHFEDDALEHMYRQMQAGREVSICAGDFSFISKHRKLETLLYELAQRRQLNLYSYKSNSDVELESRTSTMHKEIISKLEQDGRITYGIKAKVKCTLVNRPGSSCFLFRYNDPDLDDAVGVVQSSGRTSYVFELVDEFMGGLR